MFYIHILYPVFVWWQLSQASIHHMELIYHHVFMFLMLVYAIILCQYTLSLFNACSSRLHVSIFILAVSCKIGCRQCTCAFNTYLISHPLCEYRIWLLIPKYHILLYKWRHYISDSGHTVIIFACAGPCVHCFGSHSVRLYTIDCRCTLSWKWLRR